MNSMIELSEDADWTEISNLSSQKGDFVILTKDGKFRLKEFLYNEGLTGHITRDISPQAAAQWVVDTFVPAELREIVEVRP